MIFLLWSVAALAAALYCLIRAYTDLRRGKYALGAAGFLSALVFLLAPVQSQQTSVTIPIAR